MLVTNALALLKSYAKVEENDGRYRGIVEDTGAVITFEDRAGRVSRLKLSRRGDGGWAARSMTAALRHALARGNTLPGPAGTGLLVSASVERRGRSLASVASFLVMDVGDGPARLEGATDEWTDEDALGVAASAVRGEVTAEGLLSWLKRRGGAVAGFYPVRDIAC